MIKNFLLTFLLVNSTVSFSQIVNYKVSNLNSDGIGSLKYAVQYIESVKPKTSSYLFFDAALSGEILLDVPMVFENIKSLTLYFNPNVTIKVQGVDTVLVMKNIDIGTVKDLKSNSNANVVSENIDIITIQNCFTKWVYYFRDIDIATVTNGESGGINANRVFGVYVSGHRVAAGSYFANIQNTPQFGTQAKEVSLYDNKIGLQSNNLAHALTRWGVKVLNCNNTKIDIRDNEFVSVSQMATGDSIGIGLHVKNCSGSITIDSNYFAVDKTLAVAGSTFGDNLRLENISNCSKISVSNNYFHTSFDAAIRLKNVTDTATIYQNKIAYNAMTATFKDALVLENSSQIKLSKNEIGNAYGNGISLINSSNNQLTFNLLGVVKNGTTDFTVLSCGKSGVLLDKNSTKNQLKENYSVGNEGYGFENLGSNNNMGFNFAACNTLGNFYYEVTDPILQSEVEMGTLTLKVSEQWKNISLEIKNLNVPNGYNAHIYKTIQCLNYTEALLKTTYLDSVSILNGAATYIFPDGSINKTLKPEAILGGTEDEYYIVITDLNNNLVGMTKKSVADIILSTTGINKTQFSAYPNPANEVLFLETSDYFGASLQIIDATGKVLISQNLTAEKSSININPLSPGIYFLQVQSNNGNSSLKLIKK